MALRATRHRGQRALGLALFLLGAPALAADTPDQLVSFGSIAERDVFLEVSINGVNTSQLLRFHDAHGRLSVSGAALRSIGVDLSAIGMPDTREVSLDAVAGLRYVYDPAAQTVDLVLPDTLRVPYEVNTRGLPATPLATAGRGLVLNYDAYAQSDYDYRLSLYTEQRYFDSNGVFSNSGTAYLGGRGDEYVRYDTYWTRSDQETLRTLRVGDTITSSLNWSRSVRVAGIQWGRNFALRPDLVTFPVSSLSASSVVPSSVSLFVNGVQQYSGNVPPGPFVVNQIPGITGAGQATLITRDALGRTVSTSVPLYIDPRMLAAGLSSWSVEAGFVRRQFSVRSFDYDSKPVLTASGRYGYSDDLTLEAHTEAGPGLYNAGAGAMVKMGQLGVLSGSLSGSAGDFSGGQASLGYQYVRPEFSVDTQATRLIGNYGDLGSREDAPVPRQTERVTVSMPLGRSQSVALSYIGYRMPNVPMAKLGSASYTANLHSRVVLTLSAYKDFSQSNSEGVFLGLSLMLGERAQAGVSVGRQGGEDTYSVYAQSSVPYEGGWGWAVQNGRSGGMQLNQGQVQYLGQYGLVSGLVQDYGGTTQASVQAAGSLVLMDGTVIPSRRINDSFALVSTEGTPDVAVLHENRRLGRTNGSGHLLVPDLNAYQTNRISIDPEDLPVDVRLDSTRAVVVPQSGAGVLTTFQVEKYDAASVILTTPDGAFVPVGAEVAHIESGKRTVVGYDGLTFVEDVAAKNRLRVRGGGVSCEAEFEYTHSDDDPLPTLGPVVCQPLTRGRP